MGSAASRASAFPAGAIAGRGREAGERVRGAERVGEAGARGQAEARQPGDEVVQELLFAAVEMGDTGDVDP